MWTEKLRFLLFLESNRRISLALFVAFKLIFFHWKYSASLLVRFKFIISPYGRQRADAQFHILTKLSQLTRSSDGPFVNELWEPVNPTNWREHFKITWPTVEATEHFFVAIQCCTWQILFFLKNPHTRVEHEWHSWDAKLCKLDWPRAENWNENRSSLKRWLENEIFRPKTGRPIFVCVSVWQFSPNVRFGDRFNEDKSLKCHCAPLGPVPSNFNVS